MHQSAHRKIFLVCVALLVLLVAGHNFYRYYIAKDYVFHAFTLCDPSVHSCFVADPSTADPTFQSGPYEKVEVQAASAPRCLEEHTCSTDFSCAGLGPSCQLSYCSPSTLEKGESCSAPPATVTATTTPH